MRTFALLLCLCFVVCSIGACYILKKKNERERKKNNLDISFHKMRKIEKLVDKKCNEPLGPNQTPVKLLTQLGLLKEYSSEGFGDGVVAELIPPRDGDEECHGVIRINEKYSKKNKDFSYMHEIMHYILDVGINNKVAKQYTRMDTGKTENAHEQEINYAAIAYCMPLNEVLEEIKAFDRSENCCNYNFLIESLMEKYSKDRTTVLRRLREAREFQMYEARHA